MLARGAGAARRRRRDRVRDRAGARRSEVPASRRSRRSRRSSPTRSCCSSSTTPSTSSTASRGSPNGCSRRAGLQILTTSREALAVPGEAVVQVPIPVLPAVAAPVAAARGRRSTSTTRPPPRRSGCSRSGPRPSIRRSRSRSPTCAGRRDLPAGSTASPWRSSSPPRASRRCRPRRSPGGLGDRFRLLTGGRRTAVPRQQTLHALIDWSWDLLTDEDRRLLRRLSVFTGGWTVPMAAADRRRRRRRRCDPLDSIDGLTRLVDRSLVHRGPRSDDALPDARDDPPVRPRTAHRGRRGAGRSRIVTCRSTRPSRSSRRSRCAARRWSTGSIASMPSSTTSGPRSSGASRPTRGRPSAWRRPCSPTGRSGSCRRTTMSGSSRRSRSPELGSRPCPTPTRDQALAARLLGEAARLWALSGRAAVAIGWAEDAMLLAEASGDAEASSPPWSASPSRWSSPGRPGRAAPMCDRSSRTATELAEADRPMVGPRTSAGFAGASLAPSTRSRRAP